MTGTDLIALRTSLSMTQVELARATSKAESTISRYERGVRPIPKLFAAYVTHLEKERTR